MLKELVKRTGEPVHMAMMVQFDIICLDQKEGPAILNIKSGIGDKYPPHASAIGNAIVVYLHDEQLGVILRKHGMPKYTHTTITSLLALKGHLKSVREHGYALKDEETYLGVRSIAAPVRERKGDVVASLGISGVVRKNTLAVKSGHGRYLSPPGKLRMSISLIHRFRLRRLRKTT